LFRRPALSGVLVYIALRIFRVDEMVRIYRRSRFEILLVAAGAGLVIALPIETGMLLAIVLSFVHSLYIIARPYCVELARVPGSTVWHEAGVLVFAPSTPLNFTNAERIRPIAPPRGPRAQLLKGTEQICLSHLYLHLHHQEFFGRLHHLCFALCARFANSATASAVKPFVVRKSAASSRGRCFIISDRSDDTRPARARSSSASQSMISAIFRTLSSAGGGNSSRSTFDR